MSTCPHWLFADTGKRSFILFNDSPLSDETVSDADMDYVDVTGEAVQAAKSAAWSSNVYWFFIIREDDILLLNTGNPHSVRCRKKSWKFIEAFVDR